MRAARAQTGAGWTLALICGLLACSEEPGSAADSDLGGADADEPDQAPLSCQPGSAPDPTCQPSAPLSTASEACPSRELGEGGICLPSAPALTDWTCPAGWDALSALDDELVGAARLTGVAQYTVCEPPEPPASCPTGTMAVLGRDSCMPQGAACPSDGWADEATLRSRAPTFAGNVLYVSPASDDGDGTRSAPFGTVAAAIAAADESDIVALAAGDYAETLLLDRPIALLGACVEATRLEGPAGSATLALTAAAQVSDLTVAASGQGILVDGVDGPSSIAQVRVEAEGGDGIAVARSRGPVRIAGVRVDGVAGVCLAVLDSTVEMTGSSLHGCRGAGLRAEAGSTTVSLADVLIAGTRASLEDTAISRAIEVVDGGRLNGQRILLADNEGAGLLAQGGARAEIADLVIRDTAPRAVDSALGWGLILSEGSAGTFERTIVRGSHAHGVIIGQGSLLELEACLVADTRAGARDDTLGRGLVVDGASATVSSCAVLRNRESGVYVTGPDASLHLTDSLVARTAHQESNGRYGRGLQVAAEAHATIERTSLWGNLEHGLVIKEHGTAELADVRVDFTQPQVSNNEFGTGLNLTDARRVTATRIALRGNHHIGMSVSGTTVDLEVTDLAIADTQPDALASRSGLVIGDGAFAIVERAALLRHQQAFVVVTEPTTVRARDVRIAGTVSLAADPFTMVALGIGEGARLEAERVAIEDVVMAGVIVQQPGSRASLDELRISGISAAPTVGGVGIVANDGAVVELDGFVITGSALAALQIVSGARVSGINGAISANRIGINVQVDAFNLDDAFESVLTWGNENDLDYSALPVPRLEGLLE